MGTVTTAPRVEEAVVIPQTSDPQEMWKWLKVHARLTGRAILIHQVKEQGDCHLQMVQKCRELAYLLHVPIDERALIGG